MPVLNEITRLDHDVAAPPERRSWIYDKQAEGFPEQRTTKERPSLLTRALRSAAFVAAASLLAMGVTACDKPSTDTDTDAQDQEEHVGTAEQAISATCVDIFRGSGTGSVRDSYVSAYKPVNNYGWKEILAVGAFRDSLIYFDVSSIPKKANVVSASLTLKVYEVVPGHGSYPAPIFLHPGNLAPWTEDSVTWNNFEQGYDSSISIQLSGVSENAVVTTDVLSIVKPWVTGASTNRGFVLETSNGNTNQVVSWHSSESAQAGPRPELVVCYYPDLCATNPCKNGGTCAQNGGSYTCSCPAGTSGTNCEVLATPCAPNPCKNGGTCTPNGGAYTCACPSTYTGDKCQTKNACGTWGTFLCNGGTCQNTPNGPSSFACTNCPAGMSGERCEVSACPCANQDYTWKFGVKIPGAEAVPTNLGDFAETCLAPYSGKTTGRAWYPYWTFPTLNKMNSYAAYLKSFYKSSPNYCSAIFPMYTSRAISPIPGELLAMPNATGDSMCAHAWSGTLIPTTPAEDAACKAQIAAAPHVVPQLVPDLPLPILFGAPSLLALAGLLRRRFGKKVAK